MLHTVTEAQPLTPCLAFPAAPSELASRGDRLQTEVHQVNITAKYLRFVLQSGHAEFAAINRCDYGLAVGD